MWNGMPIVVCVSYNAFFVCCCNLLLCFLRDDRGLYIECWQMSGSNRMGKVHINKFYTKLCTTILEHQYHCTSLALMGNMRMVINLFGAYVSSAKYTRRGVKVVYLGFVGTGESLWVTGSSRGPVGARVTTQWRKVTLQWPQNPIIQLSHRVEYASREIQAPIKLWPLLLWARMLIWCENIDPKRAKILTLSFQNS